MSAAEKVETVIIGAGVIGLAVARALSATAVAGGGGAEILLLDRAGTVGSETSSRNSEVIHAGLYYPSESLKAKLCVRGKQQLYDYCEARAIPFRQCGKLIVATQPEHVATLSNLQKQAESNGVMDTEIWSAQKLLAREPTLSPTNLHGALWSPSTGILDSHTFMINLLADAELDGSCTLALHTQVEDAVIQNDRRIHLYAAGMWLSCRRVINCAGLWAGNIASLIHTSRDGPSAKTTTSQPPKQYFARGTYFRLQQQHQPCSFSHLIYPVPDPRGGLGVHATIDLQGQVKFGPDVEWLDVTTDPNGIDMKPDPARAESFYKSIRTYWPDLQDGALVPDYTGVRPKLQHPSLFPGQSLPFQDFMIVGPETHGVPGLIHLFGIESPGLTSSMAISDYVAKLASRC
jgi:L-2-hydroxyglutarate oxidase LhgO